MKCRICKSKIIQFLNLGRQPIANNFLPQDQFESEYFYNLEMFFCPECFTVQIGDCPPKEKIFNENYSFFTSTSKYMALHFKNLADEIKRKYLPDGGFVVEIGSNDGTFLRNFKGFRHLGIEPSGSVHKQAKKIGINSWNKFFNEEIAEEIIKSSGKADVIMTANVFPHMIERDSVLLGIKKLLKTKGIWINEEAYLGNIIDLGSYDQFYNEHIIFSSVASFENVMRRYNLCLFDVGFKAVHGGSARYYSINNMGQPTSEYIKHLIKGENLNHFSRFQEFEKRVVKSKKVLKEKLEVLNGDAVGYAAAAKSTTVLNYCGIDSSLIKKIYDTTEIKQGKYSPGAHIPIVPYSTFQKDAPKNVVLFAWNHWKEIYEKEKKVKRNWILPI